MKPVENPVDTEAGVNPVYWIILGVCVVALAGYLAWEFLGGGGPQTPESLATQVLSGSDLKEKSQAMAHLGALKDRAEVLPQLRRVLTETKDPDMKIQAITSLMQWGDPEGFPLIIDAMDDTDKKVRTVAYKNVLGNYGGTLPEKLKYSVDDAQTKRAGVVQKLKEYLVKPNAVKA